MKILEQVAQSIVEQTSSLLGVSMSITNAEGLIIGCDRKERVGTLHRVSVQVIKDGREAIFTKEKAATLENVLPGVAVPIRFNQQIIGVLGIIGEPSEVKKYVKFVRNHVEMMLQENFKTESFFVQMKTTEVFVQHLIHYKEWENKKDLESYSELLGVQFDKPKVCILINLPSLVRTHTEAKQFAKLSLLELNNLICHLFQESMEDIICPISQDQWIVIKEVKARDLLKLKKLCERAAEKLNSFMDQQSLHCKVSISYGKSYEGFGGVSRSYRQAHKTLMVGLEKRPEDTVYSFDSWTILPDIFLEGIDLSFMELFSDDIEVIWDHPEADMLVETFIAYCESSMNISQAARNLYVHRNTLIYRLNKISELFHIDTQSFEQCLVLYVALKKGT
ncbi:sugar diacid utilization regulator [Bacillus freudenreichii]|nr:sugar diacid utilization regulator [Bacillus freudenreichii]